VGTSPPCLQPPFHRSIILSGQVLFEKMVFLSSLTHIQPEAEPEKAKATTPESAERVHSTTEWELYEQAFDNRILNREKPFPTSRLGWMGEEIPAPQKKQHLLFNSLRARRKISRESRTERLPVLPESSTDKSLKASLYRDVSSSLTMAEMAQRVDNLTVQMTKFTDENIRQVRLLKEEINRVVQQLIDENDRLRDMIKAHHETFMRPRTTPYHVASASAVSLLSTGSPGGPSLDMTNPNQAMHPAFRQPRHQHLQAASPQSPFATLPTLPNSTPVPPLAPPPSRPLPPIPPLLIRGCSDNIDISSDVDTDDGRKGSNAGRFF
jgi:hypothetical protein